MSEKNLQAWLAHVEHLHSKTIDLGLDRMQTMLKRLDIRFDCPVFLVGGTNGKGSTCAFIEGVLMQAGYRVGVHTSPHLIHFNERVRLNGEDASDEALIPLFEIVETARGDMTLSYFEYTLLVILLYFKQTKPDALVLEIGLGGRLDAVNTIEPSVSIVTSVGLDHTAYLGDTREAIGWEKAHIFRSGKPAICADAQPPQTLVDYAAEIGALLKIRGRQFDFRLSERSSANPNALPTQPGLNAQSAQPALNALPTQPALNAGNARTAQCALSEPSGRRREEATWDFVSESVQWKNLPMPAMKGLHQLANASGAFEALLAVRDRLPFEEAHVRYALENVKVTGRFSPIAEDSNVYLDVGHNPHAALELKKTLETMHGKKIAVFGMLSDKDRNRVCEILHRSFDAWLVCDLSGPRGGRASELTDFLLLHGVSADKIKEFSNVGDAVDAALKEAKGTDKIIIFGSFLTVAGAAEKLKVTIGRG